MRVPFVLTVGAVPGINADSPASLDIPYIVIEYIEGETLAAHLDGRIPAEEAVEIIGQVAEALNAAHSRGIIDRDVKPKNIMMLIDFSIGAFVDGQHGVTKKGDNGVGTDLYAAPEQLEDASKATVRSDVYSAGVVLQWRKTSSSSCCLSAGSRATATPTPSSVAPLRFFLKRSYRSKLTNNGALCRLELPRHPSRWAYRPFTASTTAEELNTK